MANNNRKNTEVPEMAELIEETLPVKTEDEKSLEESINEFRDFDDEESTVFETTFSEKEGDSKAGEENTDFDWSGMFQKVDKKDTEQPEKMVQGNAQEESGIQPQVVNAGMRRVSFPEKGKVLRIFDNNTMLLQFEDVFEPEHGLTVENYELVFVVGGTHGGYINGSYKVGTKIFEGYIASMVGVNNAVMEVPGYHLLENDLEGKECDIVFVKREL